MAMATMSGERLVGMTSRRLFRGSLRVTSLPPPPLPFTNLQPDRRKTLSTSCANLATRKFIMGTSKESTTKLRGKTIDESDDVTVNLDALVGMSQDMEEGVTAFNPIPDEMTPDKLFNGIRYLDLPVVVVQCRLNNTRFRTEDSKGEQIDFVTPVEFGFINAAKRSDVAAQVTGMNVGQRLRNQNMRHVRVCVEGFNKGRIASVKGLIQAGIQVVSITDTTPIDWGWSKRAKKPKRRN